MTDDSRILEMLAYGQSLLHLGEALVVTGAIYITKCEKCEGGGYIPAGLSQHEAGTSPCPLCGDQPRR